MPSLSPRCSTTRRRPLLSACHTSRTSCLVLLTIGLMGGVACLHFGWTRVGSSSWLSPITNDRETKDAQQPTVAMRTQLRDRGTKESSRGDGGRSDRGMDSGTAGDEEVDEGMDDDEADPTMFHTDTHPTQGGATVHGGTSGQLQCKGGVAVLVSDFIPEGGPLTPWTCKLLQSYSQQKGKTTSQYEDIRVLGYGRRMIGVAHKLQVVREALKRLPDDCLVLVLDRDSLFNDHLQALQQRFKAFKKPIVLATECNIWPVNVNTTDFPSSPTHYRYVNSGTYAGINKNLRVLVKHWIAQAKAAHGTRWRGYSDQRILFDIVRSRKFESVISLDHHTKLFQAMSASVPTSCLPRKELKWDGSQFENTYTGGRPAILHFTGSKKSLQRFILPLTQSPKRGGGRVYMGLETTPRAVSDFCPV